MWNDFLSLIYPKRCPCCDNVLIKHEIGICFLCLIDLPKNKNCKDRANPVAKLFWGIAQVHIAISCYPFIKGGKVQKLIHAIKYDGETKTGERLGVELGKEIIEVKELNSVDLIIPIPIHKKTKKKRGYNQSVFIAKGVRFIMNKPIEDNLLVRRKSESSQTNKTRYQRSKAIRDHFVVTDIRKAIDKHVLLIDDVITTGATVEACINALKSIKGVKVSVATLAHS